jgi:hypothetical protein
MKLECAEPLAVHIHDQSSKCEWIQHEALEKCENLEQIKWTLCYFYLVSAYPMILLLANAKLVTQAFYLYT